MQLANEYTCNICFEDVKHTAVTLHDPMTVSVRPHDSPSVCLSVVQSAYCRIIQVFRRWKKALVGGGNMAAAFM